MKRILWLMAPLLLFAKTPSVEQLFNVQTTKVKKETVVFSKTFYGLIAPDQSRVVDVVPRFEGYVVSLYADTVYKPIKKGEPLAKVYSPEVFQAKQEYLIALRYDQERHDPRMLSSAKQKLIYLGLSGSDIKAIETDNNADAHTIIRSPADGYLFLKNVNQGGSFTPRSVLFEIVDLRNVWVEAKVPEQDIQSVLSAERFTLKPRALINTFNATHPRLNPSISNSEALATLRLDISNPKRLLVPGMFATLYATNTPKTLLTLPATSIIRKNGKWYAFKAGEFPGEYTPVPLKVKAIDADRYAVLSGLAEGDTVIRSALFLIDSDAQINGLF